jgi:hypothetical protein
MVAVGTAAGSEIDAGRLGYYRAGRLSDGFSRRVHGQRYACVALKGLAILGLEIRGRKPIANLALLGDKHFLFSQTGRSFIMFGVRGGSWIAMGEPVGPAKERLEILWQFRELCDRHGAGSAFYHITPDSLPQFVELGLTFQKLGEEGVVVLDRFSIEGLKSRSSSRSGNPAILRRRAALPCRGCCAT